MDEYLACSDLCEEKGFTRQAELFRALAGRGGKIYFVFRRGILYGVRRDIITDVGSIPCVLFLDRGQAEREAALRSADWLRDLNFNHWHDYTSLSEAEFHRRGSEILGTKYDPWPDGVDNLVPFPASATVEQVIELVKLYDRVQFYHVSAVEFGG